MAVWPVASALAALAVGEQVARGRLRIVFALPLLLAAALPLRDQPFAALAVAACGAALAFPVPVVRLALGALLAAPLLLRGSEPWPALTLLLVLAPAAFLPPATAGRTRSLAGLAVAVLAAAAGGALALPAAVALALLVAPPGGLARRLQAAWTASLLAAAALAAGFPWLRADPTASALALWQIPGEPGWRHALPLLLTALAAAAEPLLARHAARLPRGLRSESWRTSSAALATLVPLGALLLLVAAASGEPLLEHGTVLLAPAQPVWSAARAPGAARAIVLDAALSNSAGLSRGATVARLRFRLGDGRWVERPLRAGVEVDEWAARRPDVAAALGAAPPAWVSWIGPGGTFFAQRYRARIELPGEALMALEVRLAENLPAELSLAIFHLEVRR